jgi:hypothetical protein
VKQCRKQDHEANTPEGDEGATADVWIRAHGATIVNGSIFTDDHAVSVNRSGVRLEAPTGTVGAALSR